MNAKSESEIERFVCSFVSHQTRRSEKRIDDRECIAIAQLNEIATNNNMVKAFLLSLSCLHQSAAATTRVHRRNEDLQK